MPRPGEIARGSRSARYPEAGADPFQVVGLVLGADADRGDGEARLSVAVGDGAGDHAHAAVKVFLVDSPAALDGLGRFGLVALEARRIFPAHAGQSAAQFVLRQFAQAGNATPGGADQFRQARADGDVDVGDGRRGKGDDADVRIVGDLPQGDEDVVGKA